MKTVFELLNHDNTISAGACAGAVGGGDIRGSAGEARLVRTARKALRRVVLFHSGRHGGIHVADEVPAVPVREAAGQRWTYPVRGEGSPGAAVLLHRGRPPAPGGNNRRLRAVPGRKRSGSAQ